MRVLILFLGLAISACASVEAETPQQRLFAVQSEFTAVAGAVAAYIERPDCTAVVVTQCGDAGVKAKMRAAAVKASTAIKKARASADTAESDGWRVVASTALSQLATILAGAAK